MKRFTLITLLASVSLTACSKNDGVAKECLDLVDITVEMAEKTGQPLPKDRDGMIKTLENKWRTISDSEKESAAQDCKKAGEMMKMLDSMSN